MFEVSLIYDLRGWQVFRWLNRDSVIEIGNHELLNQHVLSNGVNTVSAQCESWDF